MDHGSSAIVTELGESYLAQFYYHSTLFKTEGYRPPTIAKMLKSEGIFVSRRGVAKFYQEYT